MRSKSLFQLINSSLSKLGSRAVCCFSSYNLKSQIVLLFGAIAVFASYSCSENKVIPQGAKEAETQAAPDVFAERIETIFVDSSYTKAILRARHALIFNNPPTTILRGGLTVEFLSKTTQKRLSILSADSAVVDDKTKNMTAYGHVTVISDSSQSRLETEVLNWDNARQKVYSKEFVRITSPLESVTGYGFESDVYLHNYVIYKVSGEKR